MLRKLPNSVDSSRIEKDFEICWKRMVDDLRNPKILDTTGGETAFRVWHERNGIHYKKSTGDICPLTNNDIRKAHLIFKQKGSLISTDYKSTMHGSYIPPLLFRYFIKS